MLNRHAIVLFLGLACLILLRSAPSSAYGALGTAFLVLVVGLLLDPGQPGARQGAAHILQGTGVAVLLLDGALRLQGGFGAVHLALAEVGIAVAVAGVVLELRLPYRSLKGAVLVQALGDLLFLAGLGVAALLRSKTPSTIGWVFIAIAGGLSLYAAVSNLVLQLGRLRNAQVGWRFRVLGVDSDGLQVKTPGGSAKIPWRWVQGVQRLDGRHLLLVLPSPLPNELKVAGLPVEELRTSEAPVAPDATPERYGFILHEQELGQPLTQAEALMRRHLPAT